MGNSYKEKRGKEMKQCWRCRTTTATIERHHVNGNHEDDKPQNILSLCTKCHDLVQEICDKCEDQKDCYTQKLQRCWRFEDALPPIYFKQTVKDEGLDSHPILPKHTNPNNIKDLVKIGHNIKSLMISETYLNSPEFLKHFIKCEYCGNWVRWKMSYGMVRLICAFCTIGLTIRQRPKKKRKKEAI